MHCRSEGFDKIDKRILNEDFVELLSNEIFKIKHKKDISIVITGATGCGKSNFAIQLAKKIGGIIINADSRQIYKQVPIITAQPTYNEMQDVKHCLYGFKDITDLKKQYSVCDYLMDLENTFIDIKNNYEEKIPIIVGGTMLYIDAILNGISNIPEVPIEISNTTRKKYQNVSPKIIFNDLKKIDSKYASIVDYNNPNRMIRGIEVFTATGKSIVDFWDDKKEKNNIVLSKYFNDVKKYIITLPRDILYQRIYERLDLMIKNGGIEEVKMLYEYCLNNNVEIDKLPKTIGLQELFAYFQNKISFETAVNKIKQMSKNYAKRQMTWWR